MPIPAHNVHNLILSQPQPYIPLHTVFSSCIDLILHNRLTHFNCLTHQDHNGCCLQRKSISPAESTSSIIINILQKETDILLERWLMSFDASNEPFTQDQVDTFIKQTSHFIQHAMPLSTTKLNSELYTIATLNNTTPCQTYASTGMIEFRHDAHLKAKRFYLPNVSLEVVFDENANVYFKQKPAISLQSLSSPSFVSWSKMEINAEIKPKEVEAVHPLSTTQTTNASFLSPPTIQYTHNNTPMIAVRRLSRLSLSAMESEQEEEQEESHHYEDTIMADMKSIPIPSPHMQYTHSHHSHHSQHHLCTTVAYSTSPNFIPSSSPFSFENRRSSLTLNDTHHFSLVGSFEESLLSGRMSSTPSKPIIFHCQIGVLGHGDHKPKCPAHWSIVFPAMFYNLDTEESSAGLPYVGTVDISEYVSSNDVKYPGYRIPAKGQLQVVVKNPNKTAVKLFLLPYDFTDMPKNTKTFLRQKSYMQESKLLKYAIHVQVCRNEKKKIYLYKSVRIVFANRKADAREKFTVVCEGPKEPVYIPL